MSYVNQSEYSNLLKKFNEGTKKGKLQEGYVDLKPVNSLSETSPTQMSHIYQKYPESMEEAGLSPKQQKIASAAPPEDKITGADFAALKSAKKDEGMHLGQATGPTIQTVEGRKLSNLSPDEQTQLKEYVRSMKTIKKAIQELLDKAGSTQMEGGDTTGLVMPEGE